MRVAFLTLATEGGASPRYRVYQYLPHLERAGIRCVVLPAVSAGASRRFYATGTSAGNAAYQTIECLRRLGQFAQLGLFDAVVVQKALLTVGLRGLDVLARAGARRLLVDVDDAVHLAPPHRLPAWLRLVEDVDQPARLLTRADWVVAGSETLARELRRLNRHVSVVPTSVDTDRVMPRPPAENPVPVIGWIGSPSTSPYLEILGEPLRRLAGRSAFLLRVVGASPPKLPGVPVEARPWSPHREVADLQSFDIGVMPLPETPWGRGKCGLKAIQYLAAGIPAVCSPVGAAPEIVRDGDDGFLPATPGAWEAALRALLDDPALRARLGASGRARAEERYSLRANAPRLAAALEAVRG